MPEPRPARRGGFPPAVLGAPLLGLLAAHLPLVAAGVTVLVATAVAAIVSPGAFIAVAAMLSTAFPKAGYVLGGFPIPVMMPVLLAAALLLRWRADPAPRHGVRLAVVALAWLAYRLVSLRLDGGAVGDALALAGWYGLPIVLLLLGPPLGSVRGREGAVWRTRLETGLLFACGFSLVQQVFGLEQTVVPGITRAVGSDYSAKPLLFPGGTKIPSTYQNGNVLGVITGFFFLVAAERVLRGKGRPRDGLVMAATAVATVLSGSRTVIIGLAIGVAVLVFRSGQNRRTIAVFVLGASVLVTVLLLSPALADRLIGTKASDPALVQRTGGWSNILATTSVAELLTGGPVWAQHRLDPGQAEGLIGAVQQVGVIGMALFIGVFVVVTNPPELRRWRLVLIPVAVSFLVDSAYLVFPTMFLPIARMFSPLRPEAEAEAEAPAEQAEAVEVASAVRV